MHVYKIKSWLIISLLFFICFWEKLFQFKHAKFRWHAYLQARGETKSNLEVNAHVPLYSKKIVASEMMVEFWNPTNSRRLILWSFPSSLSK